MRRLVKMLQRFWISKLILFYLNILLRPKHVDLQHLEPQF